MAEGPIVIDAGHGATLHVARCKHDLVGLGEPGLMAYKRDQHGDVIGSIVATADQARALAAALTQMVDRIEGKGNRKICDHVWVPEDNRGVMQKCPKCGLVRSEGADTGPAEKWDDMAREQLREAISEFMGGS